MRLKVTNVGWKLTHRGPRRVLWWFSRYQGPLRWSLRLDTFLIQCWRGPLRLELFSEVSHG